MGQPLSRDERRMLIELLSWNGGSHARVCDLMGCSSGNIGRWLDGGQATSTTAKRIRDTWHAEVEKRRRNPPEPTNGTSEPEPEEPSLVDLARSVVGPRTQERLSRLETRVVALEEAMRELLVELGAETSMGGDS